MRQKDSKNGSIRGRMPDGAPNPIDVYVGTRVRKARIRKGMTQQQLADAMAITFQQVQKYENGHNRIGASRMWDLSQVLHVPIGYFYEGIDEVAQGNSPRNLSAMTLRERKQPVWRINGLALSPEDMEVIRNFKRIRNPAAADHIRDLIAVLAAKEEPMPDGSEYMEDNDDVCELVDNPPPSILTRD